jgi:lysophospholipase L1-like esterase
LHHTGRAVTLDAAMDDPPLPTRRRRRLWRGRLLAVGALVLLAGLVEWGARVFLPPEVRSFKPIYVADPLGGYTLKPHLSEYALGAMVDVNAWGHRGPEWSPAPAEGALRVALLGDSLAFGFGIPFEQTVGEVLAGALQERGGRSAEVLNFGVPGLNSEQESALLERRVLGFAPDVVIVLLCGNDHEPAFAVDAQGWLVPGVDRGEGGGAPSDSAGDDGASGDVAPARSSRWGLLRNSAALLWANFTWKQWMTMRSLPGDEVSMRPEVVPGPVSAELEARVLTPLRAMAEACEEAGVPLLVASAAGPADYRAMLASFAADGGAPVLDLVALFPEARSWRDMAERFGLGWDAHPNAVAHGRWAEALYEVMQSEGLVDP